MYNLYIAEKRKQVKETEEKERKKLMKYKEKFESKSIKFNIIQFINNRHKKNYRTNTNNVQKLRKSCQRIYIRYDNS